MLSKDTNQIFGSGYSVLEKENLRGPLQKV